MPLVGGSTTWKFSSGIHCQTTAMTIQGESLVPVPAFTQYRLPANLSGFYLSWPRPAFKCLWIKVLNSLFPENKETQPVLCSSTPWHTSYWNLASDTYLHQTTVSSLIFAQVCHHQRWPRLLDSDCQVLGNGRKVYQPPQILWNNRRFDVLWGQSVRR